MEWRDGEEVWGGSKIKEGEKGLLGDGRDTVYHVHR